MSINEFVFVVFVIVCYILGGYKLLEDKESLLGWALWSIVAVAVFAIGIANLH